VKFESSFEDSLFFREGPLAQSKFFVKNCQIHDKPKAAIICSYVVVCFLANQLLKSAIQGFDGLA